LVDLMRILFLSNFYPPTRPGGYTQWCQEVADRLSSWGHTVGVLTTTYERVKAPSDETHIYRRLYLEGDLEFYRPLQFFLNWKRQQRMNLTRLEQVIAAFAPDLFFVWGMWAMSKALPARAEQLLPGRVVYYLSDYWPSATDMHTTYWQSPARHSVMLPVKWALGALALSQLRWAGQPQLRFERVMCVSSRVRELLVEAGIPVQHAEVIHGGTDVARFMPVHERGHSSSRVRLLYVGQVVPHKGVHTAIEAVGQLVNEQRIRQAHLTIVGSGHPVYEAKLRELVRSKGLQDFVTLQGPISKGEIPGLMQQFDILIFPSIYEEPLARVTQEAMAAGLAVVGTTTGGTPEILRDGVTGLTFRPEDVEGLAASLARLIADPDLRCRLARAGQGTVFEHFTLDRMARQIEAYLEQSLAAVAATPMPRPGA
jgi:glycogen synthase